MKKKFLNSFSFITTKLIVRFTITDDYSYNYINNYKTHLIKNLNWQNFLQKYISKIFYRFELSEIW
jgi:hypothetical protein